MTGLNKDVRVRFMTEGDDKTKKAMTDVAAQGDKLSAKTFKPKVELQGAPEVKKSIQAATADLDKFGSMKKTAELAANKVSLDKTMGEAKRVLDNFAGNKYVAKLGVSGLAKIDETMKRVDIQMTEFAKRVAEAKLRVKDEGGAIKVDKLALKMKQFQDKYRNVTSDVKIRGIDKDILEMRELNHEIDEFGRKSKTATANMNKRGSVGNFLGAMGGDAIKNLFGGGKGGGGGLLGDAAGEAASAGGEAGNAFTGAFGQQIKAGAIAVLAAVALTLAPAAIGMGIGLGTAVGGAFIATMTHSKLKDAVTKTFKGIESDLGKDTAPMVKPMEDMLRQLGGFVKSESGPLREMFKASTPFLAAFVKVAENAAKAIIPALTMVLKSLRPEIPAIVQGFKEFTQGIVLFLKSITAAGGMKMAMSIFKEFMTLMKFTLPAIGILMRVLEGIFDISFKEMKAVFQVFSGNFKGAWGTIKSILGDFGIKTKSVGRIWNDVWKAVESFFKSVWHDIVNIAKSIGSGIEDAFNKTIKWIRNQWNSIWSWAKNFLKSFSSAVASIWDNIFEFVKNIFGKIESSVKHIWNDIWNWAKTRIKQFSSDVASIWDNIWSFCKNLFGKIESSVKHIWDETWDWAKSRIKQFSSDVASIWDNIWSFCKNLFGKIESSVKHIWDDVWSWAKGRLKTFSSDVASIWDGIWSFCKGLFNRLENSVKNIWNDVWKWAKDRLSKFSSDVASIWDHIYNFSGNIFQRIKNNVENIWNRFWGNLKHDGASAVNWIINNVLNPLGNVWNTVVKALGLPKSIKFPAIHDVGGKQNGGLIGGRGDNTPAFANGGKVGGQGRGDRHHVLVESGEAIVPVRNVAKYANQFKADGIPGFQQGGIIGAEGLPRFTNGGAAGAGKPSGGGPGSDQNVKKSNGKAGSIGDAPGQGGSNPRSTTSKKILAQNGNISISGMIKDLKNDAIDLAFKPITAVIDTGIREVKTLGGFGELVGDAAQKLLAAIIDKMESVTGAAESGGATGQQIASYAKQFVGHRYVLGGSGDYQTNHNKPYGPWDCAGFVSQMYDHFNMGSPTSGINVTALRNWSHNKKDKKPTVGGMAFFKGADGTATHPGHVGLVTGNNQSIQAMDEALGTRMADLSGALWYATPPGGFGSGGSGGYSGTGGTAIYSYLLNNVFNGHRIAATGALASIWGESGWNPESVGTGGNGIIGWTPPRPGIVTGNATKDMAKQLPMVKQFIQQSGDEGAISEMDGATTILEAANIWGKRVERYGINDVHSAGIAAAKKIADAYGNGPHTQAKAISKEAKGGGPKGAQSLANAKHLANGGMLTEPVFGMGQRTGASYSIAENGPEYVSPIKNLGGNSFSGGGTCINIMVQGDSDPDGAARQIIQKVSTYERKKGKRGKDLTFQV